MRLYKITCARVGQYQQAAQHWCRYLQWLLFNTDEKSCKYDEIYHEKYWFHCRDFHEALNLSVNYCRTDLRTTSAKFGRGWADAENGGKFIYATVHITVSTAPIFTKLQFPSVLLSTYASLNCRKINEKCKAWWAKKHSCPDMKHCIHFTKIHEIHCSINYCGDVPYQISAK